MQAIIRDRYGSADVLRLDDVPTPSPGPGEVLVRVVAASANAADWHLMRADPFLVRMMFGLRRPKHRGLGCDVAGRIAAVGPGVSDFVVGDEVFGDLSPFGFGAFAEFVCAPAKAFAHKPAALSFRDAAALPVAGQTALQALELARTAAGHGVLIHGASGGVGTFCVQIAKTLGATVTAVCSARNLDLVRGLGADRTIDYTRDDVTRGDARFDVVIDNAAFGSPRRFRRILRESGRYVLVGGSTARMFETMLLGPLLSLRGSRRFQTLLCKPSRADLDRLAALAVSGAITPHIERTYPLADVPDAIRYLETGRARGKVLIEV